jgi:hypothetical protein
MGAGAVRRMTRCRRSTLGVRPAYHGRDENVADVHPRGIREVDVASAGLGVAYCDGGCVSRSDALHERYALGRIDADRESGT